MPTYGRSFTLINNTQFDIGAPASAGGKYLKWNIIINSQHVYK